MTMFLPEADFRLAETADNTLVIGGARSDALEAMQRELGQAARNGQRVIVLDGLDDWTPIKSSLKSRIVACKRPQDLTSLQVAGTIQSLSYLTGASQQYKEELWQVLDPDQKRLVPDVLVFSRSLSLFSGWPSNLALVLARLAELSKVLLYVDGFRDNYSPLIPMVDELLLFPHSDLLPVLVAALNDGGMSVAEFDALAPGQFVRIPDPINTVPAYVQESAR